MKPSSKAAASLAVVALGGCGLVWLIGEMASFLAHGRWAAVPAAALPTIVVRLPSRLGNPASAWPTPDREQLPHGWWWFAVATAAVLSAAAAVLAVSVVLARAIGGGERGWPTGRRSRSENKVDPRPDRAAPSEPAASCYAATAGGRPTGSRAPSGPQGSLDPLRPGPISSTRRSGPLRNAARGRRGGGSGLSGTGGGSGWGGTGGASSRGRRGGGSGWGRSGSTAWLAPGGPAAGRNVGGARWARPRDVRALVVRGRGRGRLVIGRVGGRMVAAERGHSILVFGPTQSGKTTGLAIPALLEWDGPVVATSVKDDLVGHTRAFRSTLGETWVFDPTRSVPTAGPCSPWSPLSETTTWSGAQRVAQALVSATPAQAGMTDSAFWYQTAAKLLAPLLLAAQHGGRPIAEVVRWTNLQETDEPELLLQLAGEVEAMQALRAGIARDDRVKSSIYTTLETVLAPYEDPVVARSAEQSVIDPRRLLDGRNTLYLCGPAHEQARVQGVFSALVGAVVHAAVTRYERFGPLDPPLLVVLDEAANIAPIQALDQLASTGSAMGIQLVTICQDLAQLQSRYGPDRARSIANNHRAKVALSGISDVGTLDTLSGLAGEQAIRQHTMTAEHREGRRSTTTSISYRRLAPPDELRRIPPGHGLLIYGHLAPARLALRPWYGDRTLRQKVDQFDSAAQTRIRLNG